MTQLVRASIQNTHAGSYLVGSQLIILTLQIQYSGLLRGLWGPRQIQSKVRPQKNFEILHALKCVLRDSEVPFCACIQYIPTCQLPSLFSGFRSKSTTYGALASSLVPSQK